MAKVTITIEDSEDGQIHLKFVPPIEKFDEEPTDAQCFAMYVWKTALDGLED